MGSPLALLGLLAVAVPIIIHLLGRYQSRVEKFPSLQFIGYSRQTPTSRLRINDWKLLLVRMAIVVVAALALTQPGCSPSTRDTSQVVTRVVIVDTSASMFRLTPSGPVASVVARQVADRESMGTAETHRIETESPSSALPGAIAWLAMHPGMRELVIVSDFQRGTLDSTDLASIPESMGLTLAPIATTATSVARVPNTESISAVAGSSDSAGVDAAWRAIGLSAPRDTTGRITVVYRGAVARPLVPIDSPWMASIVTSLERDVALAEAAVSSRPSANAGRGDTIASNREGQPVLLAGRSGARLEFQVLDEPASLLSAAFNRALIRALAPATPGAEMDSISWTAEDIAQWQRPAIAVAGRLPHASDGRWFWVACLALIGLETYVRSRRPVTVSA
jgi:hypothetical protein